VALAMSSRYMIRSTGDGHMNRTLNHFEHFRDAPRKLATLALAPATRQVSDNARLPSANDTIGLDCGNSSISTFDKTTCLVTDVSPFYFIMALVFVAGAVVTARIVFG
jgi:hypothetical protein